MPSQNSFTFKIDENQRARLRKRLEDSGFEFHDVPYTHFGAKKLKLSVNAYTSGKLLVQGKGAKDFVEFTLEPEILGEARLGYEAVHTPEMFEPHIGIDESGKGDFFGPLVIAGVYTGRKTTETLIEMGVKDSKKITSDQKALDLADAIKDVIGKTWSVVSIGPSRYNAMYKSFGNLNRLLAWGHATVLENILKRVPDCPRALSDQFGNPKLIIQALKERGKGIELQQRTKAESDVAVAAASILARAEFVDRLDRLGQSLKQTLPKGASAKVKEVGREIVRRQGREALANVAKEHFKTFNEVMDSA